VERKIKSGDAKETKSKKRKEDKEGGKHNEELKKRICIRSFIFILFFALLVLLLPVNFIIQDIYI